MKDVNMVGSLRGYYKSCTLSDCWLYVAVNRKEQCEGLFKSHNSSVEELECEPTFVWLLKPLTTIISCLHKGV